MAMRIVGTRLMAGDWRARGVMMVSHFRARDDTKVRTFYMPVQAANMLGTASRPNLYRR